MNLTALSLRYRWLQLPTGLLIMLLQRTPAPLLRAMVQLESLVVDQAPMLLRSGIALGAMGAYNSVAGATVFNVTATPTAASPTSGAAKTSFAVSEASGAAVSVAVSVSGAPGNPKSYSISGALPTGLTLTNATGTYVNVTSPYKMTISGTPTAAGSYPVKVTAWDGSNGTGGNSAYITLNFTITGGASNVAPSITTQPASQTVTAGNSASFTVAASGTPTPTYQWQKGGVNISGATSATYTISSTVAGDAGNYTAVATNSAGTVTSSAATLTVNAATTAPSITTQPSNQTVTAGNSASFTVAASGNPAPTYQWQKGGVNISGATSATLSLSNCQSGDAGNYTAVATNSAGSVTSSAASLTVNAAPPTSTAPSITTQPSNQTVTAGNSATFTVAASGNPAPTYQWQKGGVNIAGATSATLSLSNCQSGDAGNYTVVATNSAGSVTSSAATLTVNAAPPTNTAPSITTQPSNQTVTAGNSATFTVAASGNPAPSYQWQKGGVNISGATSATLSLSNCQSGDAGNYTAVATNSAGSVTSSAATLTVNAAPPTNTAPSITTQPSNQTVTAGSSASFTVAASGNPTPTYQWQKGGVNISGATSASFSIAATASADAGTYTVVVTNSAGTVTSTGATLTVNAAPPTSTAPSITTQPANLTVTAGNSATFTVAASGNPAPSYQWQKGGVNISGATSATLSLSNCQSGDAGNYTAVATNSAGSATSNAATLTVTSALVPHPSGITMVGSTLYLTDSTSNTVQKVTTAGVVTLLAGSSGAAGTTDAFGADALFNQPGGLVANSSGVLFVSDTANATIRRIGADGSVSTFAGSTVSRGNADGTGTQATFSAPLGLALDTNGNLYVADSTNHTVRKITSAGVVSTLAGSAGQTGFANGTGSSARFNTPSGVAVDASGNVFVADTTNHTIRKITSAGVVSTYAGASGVSGTDNGEGSDALFNQPAGLVLDGSGNLYVADTGNCTIRKITTSRVVSTLAGLPTVSGNQDGTGFSALFNQPRALTIDSSGNLYVADTGNASIRKVTPVGVVTTLSLQQGTSSGSNNGSSSGSTSGTDSHSSDGTEHADAAGGGGALSDWFLAGLGALSLLRWARRRTATGLIPLSNQDR